MGIKEILRSIWLFSASKIKSSESLSKQPTQLIIPAYNCHTLKKGFCENLFLTSGSQGENSDPAKCQDAAAQGSGFNAFAFLSFMVTVFNAVR
mgnify:CR=1 FL=1